MFRQSATRTTKNRSARRPRLGVQRLDERVVPSVTSSIRSNGVELSIVSNSMTGGGDAVHVEYANGRQQLKVVNENGLSTTYPAGRVERIVFLGGAGNDKFENQTSLTSYALGGDGDDTLIGGSGFDLHNGGNGDDVFVASGGDNTLYGGPGHDLVRRNGYRATLQDFVAGEDMVVGLVNGSQTAAELQTKGSITVSLDGRILTFNGPTGAGFQLESTWLAQSNANEVQYWSFGPVTLKSAAGDIPLGSNGFNIVADPTAVSKVGKLRSAILDGVLPLDTTNVTNPISDAAKKAGLSITLPGLSYGIATGERIRQLDPKAPLADGVPYLFAIGHTAGRFEYNGHSYDPGLNVTVAIDPTDPAIYIGIDGLPTIGRIAFGVSDHGQLPYRAENLPDGVAPPALFGNLYMSASVSLKSLDIPFTIGGDEVIDFDANNDGRGLLFNLNDALPKTISPQDIVSQLNGHVRDIAVGINGKITSELSQGLSLDIGSGSAFYLPTGQVAFRGSATNPFRGIGLDFIAPTTAGDIQGAFNIRTNRWSFKADIANSGLAGLNSQNLHVEGNNSGLAISASLKNLAGFANVQVTGRAWFNGKLDLTGQAWIDRRVNFVGGYFGASILGTVHFDRSAGGAINVWASVEAGLTGGVAGFNFNGGMVAKVDVLQNGELWFHGSGVVRGKIKVGKHLVHQGKIASVEVDLNGITFVTPPGVPNLHIDW
jgi:hypothetical protein